MKKTLIFILALLAVFAFASCDKQDGNSGTTPNDEILTPEDLEEFDKAVEILEQMTPDGWDENDYGMYIYDVWDSDFLPDIMPAPVEGIKVDQTNFKDYKHKVMNDDFSVGPIWYESYEDYREYSVSFEANVAQLDEFIAAVREKGFVGNESTNREEDEWWELEFYHEDGWFMYITFRQSTYNQEYDGHVGVSLTDSVFERPAAVDGIPLPNKGMPAYNYTEYSTILTGAEGEIDFDLAKDSIPADDDYVIWFSYYGTEAADSKEYAATLVGEGWEIVQEDDNTAEGDYYALLKKGEDYAQVDFISYDGILEVGFSSMVENLQY